MESIQNKKGMSLNDIYPAALIIISVGIILGVGLYTLSVFHNSIATTYSGSQNGINTSSGTTTLTDSALTNFNMTTIAVVFTNGSSVTNYTYTGAGVITWGSNIVADQSSLVNASYNYIYDAANSPEEAITTTQTGLATFADWIAIIVVVIAAAIVLGVVLSSFGRRRNVI